MTLLDRFFAGRNPFVVLFQALSVAVAGVAIAWTYFGMRDVMDIGGSCAEGGPYVSRVECPDSAWLMTVGIPVMTVMIILATAVAASSATPPPVFPMWAALFTSLGWNFLDYGFADPKSGSWIVCGVVFWLMAAPAYGLIGWSLRPRRHEEPGRQSVRVTWVVLYLVLGVSGWILGVVSLDAWT